MTDRNRALVLGGGGVTGIAWHTGLLLGLEERGVDVSDCDLAIGTSAGATVAAQLTSGVPLSDLFERQVNPDRQVPELEPGIGSLRMLFRFLPVMLIRNDLDRLRKRMGRIAMRSATVAPETRRQVIEQRLPRHEWPETALTLAAIDAESGEERWLDAETGAGLVDAVAASCAVPGVWPPVLIDGRHYYDGGIPSPDNATRASGYGAVLILSPMGGTKSGGLVERLAGEIAALERSGSRTAAIVPDAATRAAIGRRVLDPSKRADAAKAGLEQGRRDASELSEPWV
ncbi:MAG: patatin-like phospholipase family protein [Gemmatimonadota bacterium]